MVPSGAGKSTLLHILGMHDTGWKGEYFFEGQAIHKLGKNERMALYKQYLGFVFQSYHLLDSLAVYANSEVRLSYRNISKAERQSMVADVLDRFHIIGKKDLFPNQLSGGGATAVGGRGMSGDSEAQGDSGGRADRKPTFVAGRRDYAAIQALVR